MRRDRNAIVAVVALLAFSNRCAGEESSETGPYRLVLAWGGRGVDPGKFRGPIGIDVAGDEVFVSDAGNNRIQVFDRGGHFLRSFGHEGVELGELARPMHLDARNGKLYVAEYSNDRIQVFSLRGKPLAAIGHPGSGPGEFDAPGGVAVDDEGRLYVADFYNHRVQQLDPNGRFLRQWGETGKKGSGPARFNYPTDVALFPDGTLLVADAYNDRVQVFGADGTFLRDWGGPSSSDLSGDAPGRFRTATGVTVGAEGSVFVADFYNHRVQRFSREGELVVMVGGDPRDRGRSATQPTTRSTTRPATRPSSGPATRPAPEHGRYAFDRPTDVAVDDEGNLYVVDFGNDRIVKLVPLP